MSHQFRHSLGQHRFAAWNDAQEGHVEVRNVFQRGLPIRSQDYHVVAGGTGEKVPEETVIEGGNTYQLCSQKPPT